jgi:hypothetical protein
MLHLVRFLLLRDLFVSVHTLNGFIFEYSEMNISDVYRRALDPTYHVVIVCVTKLLTHLYLLTHLITRNICQDTLLSITLI